MQQPEEQLDLWAPGSQLTRVSGDVLRWHMEHGTQTVPAAQYIEDLEAEIRSLKQQVGLPAFAFGWQDVGWKGSHSFCYTSCKQDSIVCTLCAYTRRWPACVWAPPTRTSCSSTFKAWAPTRSC